MSELDTLWFPLELWFRCPSCLGQNGFNVLTVLDGDQSFVPFVFVSLGSKCVSTIWWGRGVVPFGWGTAGGFPHERPGFALVSWSCSGGETPNKDQPAGL